MSNYAVWGKLGAGKTKFAAWSILGAIKSGRRAAGNIDFRLERLSSRRSSYVRLPDKPTAHDLEALGHGNPGSYDEEKNGVLVLDELATWLNARTFADKSRLGVLDWLVHSRKHGWDVYFLMQGPGQIDKQVRESLLEYSVQCRKLDKVRLPFVGWMIQRFGGRGTFPRGTHGATIRLGFDLNAPLVDQLVYKGVELHDLYDTRQVFVHDPEAVTVTQLHPEFFKVPLNTEAGTWWRRQAARAAQRLVGRLAPPALERRPKLPHVAAAMQLPPEHRLRVLRRVEALAV
jgi:hypothetical protein